MIKEVKLGTGVSDRSPGQDDPPKEREGKGRGRAEQASRKPAPDADLRLVIEEENGALVYRLIDRNTGQVVAERSREEVASLAKGPDYRAGSVVSTKA